MSVRASILSSLILSLGITCPAQMISMNSTRNGGAQSSLNSNPSDGTVSGSVRSTDDHAIPDARVEIRTETGDTIANGYTDSHGMFAIPQIATGNYEILAFKGVNETRDRIFVIGNTTSVELRMATGSASVGADSSVSVAQFKVP